LGVKIVDKCRGELREIQRRALEEGSWEAGKAEAEEENEPRVRVIERGGVGEHFT
jgi:hypothetical protein